MRRVVSVAGLTAAVLLLASCAGAVPDDSDLSAAPEPPVEEAVEAVETETPEPVVELVVMQTYSGSYEDPKGFKQTVTIEASPVILGTNAERLTQAWEQVGGVGSIPCVDEHPADSGVSGWTVESAFAGFAVGTMYITNDVADFAPPEWQYQFMSREMGDSPTGVQYSSSAACSSHLIVNPAWQGNTWGPVPVVFAVRNYISPNFPTGDPAKLEDPVSVRMWGAEVVAFPLAADPL